MFINKTFIQTLVGIFLTFVVVSKAHQQDETDFRSRMGYGGIVNTTSSTNSYDQAIYYGQTHPTRDGSSWSGWCASLMWRAGNLPESSACPSAIDAYHKSKVVSTDINSAPHGAFHWWDIGSDGHVAMAMYGGWSMMASCHITYSWGQCIGSTKVSDYTKATGAKYLGWSYDYDTAELTDVRKAPKPSGLPASGTSSTGTPDTNYYKRQQVFVSNLSISYYCYLMY